MLAKTPLHELAIEFFASKPANQVFSYTNVHRCACGQLAEHLDRQFEWFHECPLKDSIWNKLDECARISDRTFGDMLKRVKHVFAS